jgi:AcrR family transcriptional regulator
MVSKRRARSRDDKQARREGILAEALAMWEKVEYADFTMSALAARLGLVKGTLYLYFPTKEELFLTLYERLLGEWFEALEEAISGPLKGPKRLAERVAESLVARPTLTRLIPLLEGILERNITPEKALAYKTWLLERVASAGAKIESALPYLKTGEGTAVLVYTQALVSGLHQMSNPAPVIAEVMQHTPKLAGLRVEFGPALKRSLSALLSGLKEKP